MSTPAEEQRYPYIDFDEEGVEILQAMARERMAHYFLNGEEPETIDILVLDNMDEKNRHLSYSSLKDVEKLAKRMIAFADDSANAFLDIRCTWPASMAEQLCEERDRLAAGAREIANSLLEQVPVEAEANSIYENSPLNADEWLAGLMQDPES